MLVCPNCKYDKITITQNLNATGSSLHTIYLQARCERCGQALVVEFVPNKIQAHYID
ncbi:MAG: hypothetical protein L6N94_01020 [Candidatus Methylarchaceae archaeon HK01M]|nr:hypothetical protein [Candidatus Methylarchaceae archaeon HK01M]